MGYKQTDNIGYTLERGIDDLLAWRDLLLNVRCRRNWRRNDTDVKGVATVSSTCEFQALSAGYGSAGEQPERRISPTGITPPGRAGGIFHRRGPNSCIQTHWPNA